LSTEKKKFWKILLTVLCFLVPIVAWLAFGERGLIHLYRIEMERQAYIDRIRELTQEKQALFEEVQRLRSDMKYIETVARKELNLIKENEIIYRFTTEKDRSSAMKSIPQKDQHGSENGKTEKEGDKDGEVK
jgi:cell division protein FtsB